MTVRGILTKNEINKWIIYLTSSQMQVMVETRPKARKYTENQFNINISNIACHMDGVKTFEKWQNICLPQGPMCTQPRRITARSNYKHHLINVKHNKLVLQWTCKHRVQKPRSRHQKMNAIQGPLHPPCGRRQSNKRKRKTMSMTTSSVACLCSRPGPGKDICMTTSIWFENPTKIVLSRLCLAMP